MIWIILIVLTIDETSRTFSLDVIPKLDSISGSIQGGASNHTIGGFTGENISIWQEYFAVIENQESSFTTISGVTAILCGEAASILPTTKFCFDLCCAATSIFLSRCSKRYWVTKQLWSFYW